jgi:hypothetical protein
VSGPNSLASCLRTQSKWILLQDPRFLGLKFLNIIICVINIVIFIIIKSINIKIIIICIIKIIIFIIINIIYKIINKFEKQLLSILKNNLRFDLKGKIKNYYYYCCYYH